MAVRWVSTTGGHLILLPENLLERWEGNHARLGCLSDYDRACNTNEWLGMIDVAGGQALVFGGDSTSGTWMEPDHLHPGTIVRCICADDVDLVLVQARNVKESLFTTEEFLYTATCTKNLLFDSCESGVNIKAQDSLDVRLEPGQYRIDTAYYDDNSMIIILHRFLRAM